MKKQLARREAMKTMAGVVGLAMASAVTHEAQAQTSEDGPITDETVYELRIYHLNDGKLPLILNRFRTRERDFFARHGMHGVAYWVPTDEPLAGRTVVYLLRHKSRAAADASWNAFRADPEWKALQAETEKDGSFVKLHESTFLKLTDFSPKI